MSVTIIYKTSLPTGADLTALKKIGLCKAFGTLFPLSTGDNTQNEALLAKYEAARKFEKRAFKKCNAISLANPVAFKKMAKTYLSSKRCLLVALFEDNKRQPLEDRMSLEELVALANQYDILKDLSEPALVWQQPKASSKGMRVICSFGPVARAAQLMVKKILELTYQPQNFQFANLTFAEKVQHAITITEEKGYAHVTEIDITDFFPSFTEEALIKALPLPKEATRQIVMSASAKWSVHPRYAHYGYISSTPGIPQGSASSAAVADWCIANMPLEKLAGSIIINHADNFFAFSASIDDAQNVSKALSVGISGLPGGNFYGETKQAATVMDDFQMLGCWVSTSKDGKLEVDPTDANLKELRKCAGKQRQRVHGRLSAAAASHSKQLRIKGLQDYLRFESMCQGWVQAFSFCGPMIKCVKEHYEYDQKHLRTTFAITDEELNPLYDASTKITVKWYSGE